MVTILLYRSRYDGYSIGRKGPTHNQDARALPVYGLYLDGARAADSRTQAYPGIGASCAYSKGYYAFKDRVRASLLDAYCTETLLATNCVAYGWPFRFAEGRSNAVAICEYALWMATAKTGTCRHGDPDNIAKAILDALFGDDRHVLPRCTSLTCGGQEPRVEITVTLLD